MRSQIANRALVPPMSATKAKLGFLLVSVAMQRTITAIYCWFKGNQAQGGFWPVQLTLLGHSGIGMVEDAGRRLHQPTGLHWLDAAFGGHHMN